MYQILFLLILTQRASSTPTPVNANDNGTEYVSWQDQPDGRGTWSILSSCVLTLVLCVYTAVHMNVAAASCTVNRRRLQWVKWVIAGIFAPELVLYTAWYQWAEARSLTKKLQTMRQNFNSADDRGKYTHLKDASEKVLDATTNILDNWTMQHSFFVVMGGYQFSPDAVIKKGSLGEDDDRPRSVLNASSFISLLEAGRADKIPFLSVKDIADRSKADNLAKALSCIQGLWLAFQLLGRLIQNLTITELEVNVFAHVLCAICMYAFWMKKPLNIQNPVFVKHEGLDTWLLLHCNLTWATRFKFTYTGVEYCSQLVNSNTRPIIHEHEVGQWDTYCRQCEDNRKCYEWTYRSIIALILETENIRQTPQEIIELLNQNNPGENFVDFIIPAEKLDRKIKTDLVKTYPSGVSRSSFYIRTQKDLDIFLQLWQLVDRKKIFEQFEPLGVLDRCARMLDQNERESERVWMTRAAIMIIISSGYGGIHASLWWHHFPTIIERWLWRISSLVIAGNGPFILSLIFFLILAETDGGKEVFGSNNAFDFIRKPLAKLRAATYDSKNPTIKLISKYVYYFVLCVVAFIQLIFAFSRVFLFVEAFISLRSQPPSAYQTPTWTQWLPHL